MYKMSWDESEFSKKANEKREKEFIEKLKALLAEYKGEITLEDCSSGYHINHKIDINLGGYTDEETQEYVRDKTVELGNYITGED